jgi:hypothetical protein
VKNCSLVDFELDCNDFIGQVENVQDCETREINPAYLQAVAQQQHNAKPRQKHQQQYLDVLLHHHEAISQDKFDLGRTDTLMHEIALKTQEPIYVKQFKIPDSQHTELERHVLEWLKLGVIQPALSRYNSPIFAIMKKDDNVCLVQNLGLLTNSPTLTSIP